jgi:hypothetical protein
VPFEVIDIRPIDVDCDATRTRRDVATRAMNKVTRDV